MFVIVEKNPIQNSNHKNLQINTFIQEKMASICEGRHILNYFINHHFSIQFTLDFFINIISKKYI